MKNQPSLSPEGKGWVKHPSENVLFREFQDFRPAAIISLGEQKTS
jgi:hypothetical protein